MRLEAIDWAFIVGYGVFAFGVGIYFSRRANQSIEEFFVAGRSLPWWIAGTSIVATTFAVDTPLVIAGFIRTGGIYENWLWWCVLMGGMLSVFFYARLWRRAGILTDVEFMELRYTGRSAAVLRGMMAIYGGVLYNCVIMGWVILAMTKICEVLLGWDKVSSIAIMMTLALSYTLLSGFWGVVVTDFVQFIMAMFGSIALAGIVLWKMGGASGMIVQIQATEAFDPKVFHMVPDFKTAGKLALLTFLAQVSVQWWAKGQGDGYIVQRLFSTKDERHSMLAALWFNFAHYVIRPWPWIIVGLASLVYSPIVAGEDPELAYPKMIAEFLPVGLRGLMVASLIAAFMSTMDTHLNWGASYLINDLYKRFIVRDASPKHYVRASQVAMLILMVMGALTAWQSSSVTAVWKYFFVLTAGVGFVGLLRWYWWRVNAWSEISALASSFLIANGFLWARWADGFGLMSANAMSKIEWFYSGDAYPHRLTTIVLTCTVIWLGVTMLTRPVATDHLKMFYRRVRPGGWWGPIAESCPEVRREKSRGLWLGWISGVVCVYSGLFGVGYLCLAQPARAIACLAVAFLSGWYMLASVSDEPSTSEVIES